MLRKPALAMTAVMAAAASACGGSFEIQGMTSYGPLAAFSILYSLPVVLRYAFGLQGNVKG